MQRDFYHGLVGSTEGPVSMIEFWDGLQEKT